MTNKYAPPEQEHEYLKYNGLASIAIGFVLFFSVAYSALSTQMGVHQSVKAGLMGAGVISVISIFYLLIKGNKFNHMLRFKSVWLANYGDEFLNHVNLVGYKLAFWLMLFLLGAGYLGVFDFLALSTKNFSTLIMSIALIAYGLTIVIKLRDADE